jgi:alginate O-acetyltransferase complex protein AlgI
MTIQSASYFVCLAVLWLLSIRLHRPRLRQLVLLIASYVFYMTWGIGFAVILIASSFLNYCYGAFLKRNPSAKRLWGGVCLNIALLCYYKYLPIVGGMLPTGSAMAQFVRHIAMPIGISFWTFQALSYLLDIYREEDIDPSALEFFLYMAFWPTVLSGPVCRLSQMLPQFRQVWQANWQDIREGTTRILIGLVMKLFLSQLLLFGSQPKDGVGAGFDQIAGGWSGLDVWVLAIGFGFQLYFDFAGYSHIVIGSARLFGLRLHENFDRPFLSTSPSMFWTRWHMSLSFWIRDYLFIPLATLRREPWWRYFALFASMVIFGIWHRGSILFVIWGAYHGLLLVAHRLLQQQRKAHNINVSPVLDNSLSWAATFAVVSLSWIIFRAATLQQAMTMLRAVFDVTSYRHSVLPSHFTRIVLGVTVAYILWNGIRVWVTARYHDCADEFTAASRDSAPPAQKAFALLWENRWAVEVPLLILALCCGLAIASVQKSALSPFMYQGF